MPICIYINNLSQLQLQKAQERVFLAGLRAAKEMAATRWKPPHTLTRWQWVLTFRDVVYLELSTTRTLDLREPPPFFFLLCFLSIDLAIYLFLKSSLILFYS